MGIDTPRRVLFSCQADRTNEKEAGYARPSEQAHSSWCQRSTMRQPSGARPR